MEESDDTRNVVVCNDCHHDVPVAFALALVTETKLSLTAFAKCLWCYEHGDKRSLMFNVNISTSEIVEATKHGLLVMRAVK